MDMRDLEAEVQRLVGYDCFVTSGVNENGPYINVNARARLLKIWIPRQGVDPARVAKMVRGYLDEPKAPAYKELHYQPADGPSDSSRVG